MRVNMIYFKPTSGKFYASAAGEVLGSDVYKVADQIRSMRKAGNLPGLIPGSGQQFHVLFYYNDLPHLVLL